MEPLLSTQLRANGTSYLSRRLQVLPLKSKNYANSARTLYLGIGSFSCPWVTQ